MLHPEGELKRVDAAFQFRERSGLFDVTSIQLAQQVEQLQERPQG